MLEFDQINWTWTLIELGSTKLYLSQVQQLIQLLKHWLDLDQFDLGDVWRDPPSGHRIYRRISLFIHVMWVDQDKAFQKSVERC